MSKEGYGDMPAEIREGFERLIAAGEVSRPELDEAVMFMRELEGQVARGEVREEDVGEIILSFAVAQLASGRAS